jgi:hypothetical protein
MTIRVTVLVMATCAASYVQHLRALSVAGVWTEHRI